MQTISEDEVVRQLLTHRTRLLAYFCSIVCDHSVAEDLYQEVSLEAIRKRAELRDPLALPAWLRRTARFKALSHLRDRGREKQRFSDAVLDELDRFWDEEFPQAQESYLEALRDCLSHLAPKARRMIDLRYAEQKEGDEAARLLGMARGSFYVAMSRIHGSLRGCIERALAREAADG